MKELKRFAKIFLFVQLSMIFAFAFDIWLLNGAKFEMPILSPNAPRAMFIAWVFLSIYSSIIIIAFMLKNPSHPPIVKHK